MVGVFAVSLAGVVAQQLLLIGIVVGFTFLSVGMLLAAFIDMKKTSATLQNNSSRPTLQSYLDVLFSLMLHLP
jgi:hypothetical protein